MRTIARCDHSLTHPEPGGPSMTDGRSPPVIAAVASLRKLSSVCYAALQVRHIAERCDHSLTHPEPGGPSMTAGLLPPVIAPRRPLGRLRAVDEILLQFNFLNICNLFGGLNVIAFAAQSSVCLEQCI